MSTPAPRKFVYLSSDPYKTPRPTRRATGPGSQASSLRQSSSAQFARTPRFAKPSRDNTDDIDSSFEDRSSPPDTKNGRTARPVSGNYDNLIDGNDEDVDEGHRSEHLRMKSEFVQFDNSANRPAKALDTIQDVEEDDFPQPATKRLKTSYERAKHQDAILISSSDSETSDHYKKQSTHHSTSKSFHSDLSDDVLLSFEKYTRPGATILRFKTPAPPMTSTQQPSKPIFKPPLPSQLTQNTPLPETFSPSRRRGRCEYIPGGHADTIRNWVLELAAAEFGPKQEVEGKKRMLIVTEVRHDVEGRCAMVRDEKGVEWLLVSQGVQGVAGTAGIRVGIVVEMDGEGTTWRIGLGDEGATEGVKGEGAREKTAMSVNVSVLWKVKR